MAELRLVYNLSSPVLKSGVTQAISISSVNIIVAKDKVKIYINGSIIGPKQVVMTLKLIPS